MKKIWLIFLLLSLSGCWNYRELNEMAIVGAVAIDYDEDTKLFNTGVQIFNVKKNSGDSGEGGSKGAPVVFYDSKAKTVHEALRNIIYESPKKIYIGHIDVLILGENISVKNLKHSLDFFFRDPESRKDFQVLIAKGEKANDVLKILTPLESISSTSIKHSLFTNNLYKGTALPISYDEFLSNLFNEGTTALLPTIQIKGSVKKGSDTESVEKTYGSSELLIDSMAYFSGYKFQGYLTRTESLTYSILVNKVKQTVMSVKCDEKNYFATEILNVKTKIKPNIDKNIVNITISADGGLSEYNCEDNLFKVESMDRINRLTENKVKKDVEKLIDKMQNEYKNDILGIGNMIYKNNPKYWKKNKDNWIDIFSNLEFKVTAKFNISRKGSSVSTTTEGVSHEQENR